MSTDDHVTISIPRSCLTVVESPRCVSQRTAERVLGLPRRTFLELVREFGASGGAVIATGKLRIVEIDPFVAWLRSRSVKSTTPTRDDDLGDLAVELGLRARRCRHA